jgi:cold shock protein
MRCKVQIARFFLRLVGRSGRGRVMALERSSERFAPVLPAHFRAKKFGRSLMSVGTVKWFDVKKGFGFIINDAGKDVFVHYTSIEGDGFRSLKDGERVEYEQIEGNKGLHALQVKRPERNAVAATAAVAVSQ